jgi:hypothetical protein
MASEWYYTKNGIQNGPVTSLELKGLAESNLLSPTDLVWKEGMAEWRPASTIKEVFQVSNLPPPIPGKTNATSLNSEAIKRKLYDIKDEVVHNFMKQSSKDSNVLCDTCGKEFEKSESVCSNCGKKKRMSLKRKVIYGFGGFFLLTVIASAGNQKEARELNTAVPVNGDINVKDVSSGNTKSKSELKKPRNSKTDYSLGQEFVLGDYKYVVLRFQTFSKIGKFMVAKASANASFVVVEYTIENMSNESKTVLSDDFKLKDTSDRTYKPSSDANTALLEDEDKDFLLSELQPGIPKKMKQAFEIPQSSIDNGLILIVPKKGFFKSGEVKVQLN